MGTKIAFVCNCTKFYFSFPNLAVKKNFKAHIVLFSVSDSMLSMAACVKSLQSEFCHLRSGNSVPSAKFWRFNQRLWGKNPGCVFLILVFFQQKNSQMYQWHWSDKFQKLIEITNMFPYLQMFLFINMVEHMECLSRSHMHTYTSNIGLCTYLRKTSYKKKKHYTV